MPPRASLYWILGFLALMLACPACTPDIGDSCLVHSDCSQTGDRICEPNFPGGYCTIFNCEPGTCPSEANCVAFYSAPSSSSENLACGDPTDRRFQRAFCMKTCDGDGDCRSGYSCIDYASPDNAVVAVVVERGSYNPRVCTLKPPPSRPRNADGTSANVCSPPQDASFPTPPGPDGGARDGGPRDGAARDAAPDAPSTAPEAAPPTDGAVTDAANRGSP
jgi:hypothetical protein